MTREEILNQVSQDKEYRKICNSIAKGTNLANDLYQEMFIILCELDEEKLKAYHGEGYLRFYTYRAMYYQFTSPHKEFYKNYRQKYTPIPQDLTVEDTCDYDPQIDIALNAIEQALSAIGHYEETLMKEYLKAGSYRKLEALTTIPYKSICNTINDTKKKIREQLKNDPGTL